ncbi:hypothetical protein ABIB57_003012 [Devosia sp. UYZn731]
MADTKARVVQTKPAAPRPVLKPVADMPTTYAPRIAY